MALSFVQYEGDGATETFAVPFPYLAKAHVEVRVDLDLTAHTWDDAQTIRISPAPANGAVIQFRRITPRDSRMVDFVDGSVLTETDLDLADTQVFMIVQEAIDIAGGTLELLPDGSYGAGGRRIKELGTPVEARDAVTKEYHDGVYIPEMNALLAATTSEKNTAVTAKNDAVTARNAAQASQAAAATSATNAATSEANALAYRNTAETHKNSAGTSATNAATSEANALSYRNAADGHRIDAASSATSASASAGNAATSATLAQDWAIKTSGAVSGGEWSAKKHAQDAAASAAAAATFDPNSYVAKAGGTFTGALTVAADLKSYRPSENGGNAGVLYLNQAGSRYLYWDGTNYNFPGANIAVPGVSAGASGYHTTGGIHIQNAANYITMQDTDWGTRYIHHNGGTIGFLNSGGGWSHQFQNDGSMNGANWIVSTDGNLYGTVWGGWLSTWLANNKANINGNSSNYWTCDYLRPESAVSTSIVYSVGSAVSAIGARTHNTAGSADGYGIIVDFNRGGTTSYEFLRCRSAMSSTSDNEFRITGTGASFSDGAHTTTGADYAEYFEWADGNPKNEDRRGLVVVLEAGKIRPVKMGDDLNYVIGVVSARPSIVGDGASERWKDKYLRDEWGCDIFETAEIVEWDIRKKGKGPKGEDTDTLDTVFYDVDKVPANVRVPANARRSTIDRRVLNPDYNPNRPYIPREQRKEWSAIGLVGKLRVLKGQPIPQGWLKMREINERIDEYLVR